jgi:hypothetical protein
MPTLQLNEALMPFAGREMAADMRLDIPTTDWRYELRKPTHAVPRLIVPDGVRMIGAFSWRTLRDS